ncbi:2'-5' RNA ligase family protein [Leptolyngbya sp. FACHB-711]|uniref:2'-5' RNA ligase family protein n=1 Tax=unclassified Leptolyngbya TaxID=2650499 RepID=UPI0018EF8A6C|nr:2'-5' RNA ligase family protein [Leptolyngbya sp. FACHB-711]
MAHQPIFYAPDSNQQAMPGSFPAGAIDALPLVLTLKLDSASFDRLNQLRQEYFPSHRNFLPAHVTLFHALPGNQETSIRETLQIACANTARFPLAFPTLRFLGRGFAAEIEAPELIQLQHQLMADWHSELTPQDRQKYKPHVTIQNKVSPEVAKPQYEQAARAWQPLSGFGEGLLLWYYKGGPWELVEAFEFQSNSPNGETGSHCAEAGTTPLDRR